MGTDREQGNMDTVKQLWKTFGGGGEEKAWEVDTCLPGRGAKPWAMAMVSCLFSWTSLFPACPLRRERSWHIAKVAGLCRDGRMRLSCAYMCVCLCAAIRQVCLPAAQVSALRNHNTVESGNLASTFFVLGWTMFPVKGFRIPRYPSPCPKRVVDVLGCPVHHVFVAAYSVHSTVARTSMGPLGNPRALTQVLPKYPSTSPPRRWPFQPHAHLVHHGTASDPARMSCTPSLCVAAARRIGATAASEMHGVYLVISRSHAPPKVSFPHYYSTPTLCVCFRQCHLLRPNGYLGLTVGSELASSAAAVPHHTGMSCLTGSSGRDKYAT